LLAHPGLADLETLEIFCSALRDEGAEEVAAATALSGLESLVLSHNGIKERGRAALRSAPHLFAVKRLST
jgi:hypothetical protein